MPDLLELKQPISNLWVFGEQTFYVYGNRELRELMKEKIMSKRKKYTKMEKDLMAENQRLTIERNDALRKINGLEYELKAANRDAESHQKLVDDFETLSNGVKFAMRILSNVYPSMDSVANLQRNIGRAEESLRCSMMAAGAIPMVVETNAIDTCAKAKISIGHGGGSYSSTKERY